MWSGMKTITLALWAPLLSGMLVGASTWLVWRYTALPCTPENAVELMCRPGPLARYLSTMVLHHCIIHSSIAITITGGSDLMLFLRERQRNNEERRRNDQMMELMKNTLEQAAEERRQSEERAAEERRQSEERAAEERRQSEERVAEERQQAAAERQAFLDALTRLTEAISQNGRDRE